MTQEAYEAILTRFNELFSQVMEAVEALGPGRLADIDVELDRIYDRI